ncbi:MAG TPA: hypothetical protein VHP36_00730 [Chitinispirillaceae bacterium]|nr:hypothetical protein [Chitinispirillaceae bacterium]
MTRNISLFRRCRVGKIILMLCLLTFALMQMSCSGESDELARKKLETILKDDLKTIAEGIPDSALMANPRYEIVFYKQYKAWDYSKKAVADFYFLKNINKKVIRKYRYHTGKRMWDRYFNEYSSYSDSISGSKPSSP